jgi:uncharacterized protein YcsI (UPF0317 family)
MGDRAALHALRHEIRAGRFAGITGGLAAGFVQANLVILPAARARDFAAWCEANPKPCPLLAVGTPGAWRLEDLGEIDIRTDVPRYRVFRDGIAEADVLDIRNLWQDDLVAFAIGCSLSFEGALTRAGVHLRSFAPGLTCAAYRTRLPTVPVGPFRADLVVTMRAIREDEVDTAIRVTSAHPSQHGAPVHVGDPAPIGIDDLGDNIEGLGLATLEENEVPVFWACGVTAIDAVAAARLPLAITHAPAHMLITDIPVDEGPA